MIKTADKKQQKVVVFFIDVDNFKMINDTYGHHVGDVLLQRISRKLQDLFGERDYIVRWGGDEFLVLLLCDDVTGIDILRNHLLQKLYKENEDILVKVTLSVGYAIYPDEGTHLYQIIEAADKNMYQQKSRTNCIEERLRKL